MVGCLTYPSAQTAMLLRHKPVLCNYYVTYRCNASCGFCDIWERPSPYIKIEDVKNNLQDLKQLGVKVIDFTGGEPLLHRQLPAFLSLAKALGFITTVTTNGLLYPKMAKDLRGLIDMLHFSLDFATAERHNQSRNVKCFDKVMESIEVAKSLGERPDIIYTVTNQSIQDIDKVYSGITRPNNLMLLLNPIFTYAGYGESEALSPTDLKALNSIAKQKGVYLNQAFVELRRAGGNRINQPVCKASSTTIVITPENKLVAPCYHMGLKEFDINNNLAQVYKSEAYTRLALLEGRMPACQNCAINCYMQPSFAVNLNKYWFLALPSTLKYNLAKGTYKQLLS